MDAYGIDWRKFELSGINNLVRMDSTFLLCRTN